MIFSVIYRMKPVTRRILDISRAWMPLKLNVSRKTSLLLKIFFGLYIITAMLI